MIYCAHGVRVRGMRPEIVYALQLAGMWSIETGVDVYVTSAVEGKHRWGSLHYAGAAVDFDVVTEPTGENLESLQFYLRKGLTSEYDVVLESLGEPNEHLHVEFQPKEA